jgi:hypothetical protein
VKFYPLNEFRFINLCESEHFVLDFDKKGIYNGLMVCKPKNIVLLRAIRQIVENVKNKYYGNHELQPTGPKLLAKFISLKNHFVDLYHEELAKDANYKIISYKNIPIIKSYHGHLNERDMYSKKKHYSELWRNRNIYA